MRSLTGLVTATVFLPILGLSSGCGGPTDTLNRQAVSGQVTLQGELLDTGVVLFDTQDSAKGTSGGAVITNGQFEIAKKRGLPPGVYTVRISSPDNNTATSAQDEMPGDSSRVAKERVPKSWNIDSEETITVDIGGKNRFELAIP